MDRVTLIISRIRKLQEIKRYPVVAIDGRCASGKTTLAKAISEQIDCNIIHTDDFFLRPHRRTASRLNEPGGNIDYERFSDEVLIPLKKGVDFFYRPYNCHTADFGEPVEIKSGKTTIIEGAYSCHPKFAFQYDLKFFSDIDSEEQLKRIKNRNGEIMLEKFKTMWIPMEEKYFSEFNIKETCELI